MDETLTKRQLQAMETKERIYRSAVELFLERSYDEVKISDICEKANVSIGVFYHYFPSKGHVFNEGYLSFEKDLRHYLAGLTVDPLETLRLTVDFYLKANRNLGPAYRSVFLRNQLEIKDSQIIRNLMRTTLREYVERAVSEGFLIGDPQEISELLIRSLRGHIFEWALFDGAFDLVEAGGRITDIILSHYSTGRVRS